MGEIQKIDYQIGQYYWFKDSPNEEEYLVRVNDVFEDNLLVTNLQSMIAFHIWDDEYHNLTPYALQDGDLIYRESIGDDGTEVEIAEVVQVRWESGMYVGIINFHDNEKVQSIEAQTILDNFNF